MLPGARIVDNNHIGGYPDSPVGDAWRLYALKTHASVYSAEAARIEAIGEGPTPSNDALPPYNDGEPVLTIGFLNSCHTGTTNAFAKGLTWPLGTRYLPNPMGGDENEAVVSFLPSSYFPPALYAELKFWEVLLTNGSTVDAARSAAFTEYNNEVDDFNENRRPDQSALAHLDENDMTLFGDFNARGKTVYGGNGSNWWR